MDFYRERLVAELAVQRASVLTRKVLSAVNKGSLVKADSSPVTIADFAAQAILISAIHAAFPSDSFVGEEDSDALRKDASLQERVWELVSSTRLDDQESEDMLASPSSIDEVFDLIDLGGRGVGGRVGRVWMMDPIDGTATFLRGEQYAVSLSLVVDGLEMVGVLGCPNLSLATGKVEETSVDKDGMGLMLSAVKGKGADIRPMGRGSLQPAQRIPISTEGPANLRDLHFVDFTRSDIWSQEKVRSVAERIGAEYPWSDIWCAHMRYVALIVGGGDVQVRIPVKKDKRSFVWDHAGTQLIYTEVGGKITDLEGKEMDFGAGRSLSNNWGFIAAKNTIKRMLVVDNNKIDVLPYESNQTRNRVRVQAFWSKSLPRYSHLTQKFHIRHYQGFKIPKFPRRVFARTIDLCQPSGNTFLVYNFAMCRWQKLNHSLRIRRIKQLSRSIIFGLA